MTITIMHFGGKLLDAAVTSAALARKTSGAVRKNARVRESEAHVTTTHVACEACENSAGCGGIMEQKLDEVEKEGGMIRGKIDASTTARAMRRSPSRHLVDGHNHALFVKNVLDTRSENRVSEGKLMVAGTYLT